MFYLHRLDMIDLAESLVIYNYMDLQVAHYKCTNSFVVINTWPTVIFNRSYKPVCLQTATIRIVINYTCYVD